MPEEKKPEKKVRAITLHVPSFSWKYISIILGILLILSLYFNVRPTGKFVGTMGLSGLVCIHPNGYDTSQIDDWVKEIGVSLSTYTADWVRGPVGLLFSDTSVDIVDLSTRKDFFVSVCDATSNQKACSVAEEEEEQSAKTACEQIEKVDKPKLQAFVVSYCPYGLQMQRILVPVHELLKDVADIEVRYIGDVQDGKITAMHGEQEAEENHRQICIREEQEDKFWGYTACFIKAGNAESCLNTTGIDKNKLSSCMSDPKRGVAYAQEDFNLASKYGVTGSPTLILNGEKSSEFEFGGRTAEAVKSMICCAFKDEPTVCSQELEKTQAATGFSETYASSGSSGSSGSC